MNSKTFFTAALCAAAANAISIDSYELESTDLTGEELMGNSAEQMPMEEMDHVIHDSYPELDAEEVN